MSNVDVIKYPWMSINFPLSFYRLNQLSILDPKSTNHILISFNIRCCLLPFHLHHGNKGNNDNPWSSYIIIFYSTKVEIIKKKFSSKLGPPYFLWKSHLSGQKVWQKRMVTHFSIEEKWFHQNLNSFSPNIHLLTSTHLLYLYITFLWHTFYFICILLFFGTYFTFLCTCIHQ